MIALGCRFGRTRRLTWLAVIAAWALAAAGPPAANGNPSPAPGNGAWRPGPQRYGMSSEQTDVRMSDGIYPNATITSATDPRTGQVVADRFPVLMTIAPDGKDEPVFQGVNVTPASDFVPYGYVDVVVDVRGTGSSGGTFELFGPREVK